MHINAYKRRKTSANDSPQFALAERVDVPGDGGNPGAAHAQRNTRTDLTLRPRLQAGKELRKQSGRLTSGQDDRAGRMDEVLNA